MKATVKSAARITMVVVLVAFVMLLSGNVVVPQGAARTVVLISIDGLHPDYVTQADKLGLTIPNLRQLKRDGAHAAGVQGVIPTVTYPSHATLVTGVSPASHGIHSNTTFDPLSKNQGAWYWYASDIKVPTLWDVAAERRLSTGNVHWPVTVSANITWNIPQYWRTGTPDDRKLVEALSTRGLLDTLERAIGPYADGIDESIEGDERRARFVVQLLKTKRPSVMFAYFTALDHEQHEKGPWTPEAKAILERIDRIVGDVRRAAAEASNSRAVVAVVSDHGFAATQKSLNLGVAFVEAGLITLGPDGKPTAWLAMPWGAGASAAIVITDSAPASTRDRVRAVLDRVGADTANGIDAILDASALKSRGGFPTASFHVGLKPGFTAGSATRGPLVTPSTVKGTHGHLNTMRELHASFFIAGPGIPAGKSLGVVDMRDIAPTLAAILGFKLPAAEGRNLLPDGL